MQQNFYLGLSGTRPCSKGLTGRIGNRPKPPDGSQNPNWWQVRSPVLFGRSSIEIVAQPKNLHFYIKKSQYYILDSYFQNFIVPCSYWIHMPCHSLCSIFDWCVFDFILFWWFSTLVCYWYVYIMMCSLLLYRRWFFIYTLILVCNNNLCVIRISYVLDFLIRNYTTYPNIFHAFWNS